MRQMRCVGCGTTYDPELCPKCPDSSFAEPEDEDSFRRCVVCGDEERGCPRCGGWLLEELDDEEMLGKPEDGHAQPPPPLWPELEPVIKLLKELDKDESGTPNYVSVVTFFDRNGITGDEERLWRHFIDVVVDERRAVSAELFAPDRDDEQKGTAGA